MAAKILLPRKRAGRNNVALGINSPDNRRGRTGEIQGLVDLFLEQDAIRL